MKNKKTKLISLLLCLVMLVAMGVLGVTVAYAADGDTCADCSGTYNNGFCSSVSTHYEEPTTNSDGYYEIDNAGKLYWFQKKVNSGAVGSRSKAILTADIVVNENVIVDGEFNSAESGSFRQWGYFIGSNSYPFSGTFDGDGHTISGLYSYQTANLSGFSLFGFVSTGTIKNLGVINSYVSGATDFAGIVYKVTNSATITNCYYVGVVNNVTTTVGGIAGTVDAGAKIENCYSAVTITNSTATNSGTVVSYSGLRLTNCYYLSDTSNSSGGKTAAQFASGEVAYLLNNRVTDGSQAFYQNIGSDAYPSFTGGTVYDQKYCDGVTDTGVYANTTGIHSESVANYVNGFCANNGCDTYESADLVDGVYQIGNAGQLYWFAREMNNGNTRLKAILTDNITVNENVLDEDGNLISGTYRSWTPIGNNNVRYAGTFDGAGKTISGLYYVNTSTSVYDVGNRYIGLFGYVNGAGTVKNVGVVDSYIEAYEYVGGIAGMNKGTINNCFNASTVSGNESVGGIAGYNWADVKGTVLDCYNVGKVTAYINVGGIVGFSSSGSITGCYNAGYVSGSNCGGIVGIICNTALSNCYNVGTVSANMTNIGGIAGKAQDSGSITNCFNTGSVSGKGSVSAILASNIGTYTVSNCYYLSDTSNSSGGKTAAQFASGEVAYLLNAGVTDGTQAYYQNFDTDDYPTFSATETVYAQKDCADFVTGLYSNDASIVDDTSVHATGSVTVSGASLTATCACGAHKVTYTVTAPARPVFDGTTAFKPTVAHDWNTPGVDFDAVMDVANLVYNYTYNGSNATDSTDFTQVGTYVAKVALPGHESTVATVTYEVIMPEPLMNTQELNEALKDKGVTAIYINGTLPEGWTLNADGSLTKGVASVSPIPVSGKSTISEVYLYIVNGEAYIVSAEITTDYVKVDMSEGYTGDKYFAFLKNVTKIDLTNLDTTGETDMSSMFDGCSALTEIKFGDRFDTSAVTDMSRMFADCSALTEIDLSKFDTSNVKNMSKLFWKCNSLTEIDVTSFDTSKVTDMSGMFACGHLENIAFDESFVTSNVTNMSQMFCYDGQDNNHEIVSTTTNLQNFIDTFDTSKVTTMDEMFGFTWFSELDLSEFETDSLESAHWMFHKGHLDILTLPTGFEALMYDLGLNEFGDGWIHQDGTHYDEFLKGTEYPAGTYAAHRHEDGVGIVYKFSVSDTDPSAVDVYCFCGDKVHTYQIVNPGVLKAEGDGTTVVYNFEFVCTMCGEGANCHDGLFGITPTIYMYNEETGEYDIVVTEVIHAGKYKVDMHVAGAVEPWSYETSDYSANASLEFTVEEKRELHIEGSVGNDNLTSSTILGRDDVLIVETANGIQVITDFAVTDNTGISSLILIPKYDSAAFEIVAISVNGVKWTLSSVDTVTSTATFVNDEGVAWEVTYTGDEDEGYTGDFKIAMEGLPVSSVTGEKFIQIIYQSTDAIANGEYTFGFDLTKSESYSVIEGDSTYTGIEVEIFVDAEATVYVIVPAAGEITIDPDQSLVYDGEAIISAGKLQTELERYARAILYHYNGYHLVLPEGVTVDWEGTYVTVKWYDADGNLRTEAPKNAGTYYIGVSAIGNEFLTAVDEVRVAFTITPYVLDGVTGTGTDKPYNGSEQTWAEDEITVNFDINDSDLLNGVTLKEYGDAFGIDTYISSVVVSGGGLNAGEYTLTVTLKSTGNYAFGYNEDGTAVTEKTIEVKVNITKLSFTITAENKNSAYSDALAELTYTISGTGLTEEQIALIIAELEGNNRLLLTWTTDFTNISNVGDYIIGIAIAEGLVDGVQLDNYDIITPIAGTYTITRKVIEAPTFGDFVYNATEKGYDIGEGLADGIVNIGDYIASIESLGGYPFTIVSEEGNKATNVGEYSFVVALINNNFVWSDYNNTTDADVLNRTLTWSITQASITITFDKFTDTIHTSQYLDALAEIQYAIENGTLGTLFGDDAIDSIITITIDGTPLADINLAELTVGTYTVSATVIDPDNGNYAVTIIDGSYNVTKKVLGTDKDAIISMIAGIIKDYTGEELTWADGDFEVKDWAYEDLVAWTEVLQISGATANDLYDYINANGKVVGGVWTPYWGTEGYTGVEKYFYSVTVKLLNTENFVLYVETSDAGETEVTEMTTDEAEVFIAQATNDKVSGPTVSGINDLVNIKVDYEVDFEDKATTTIQFFYAEDTVIGETTYAANTLVGTEGLVAGNKYYAVVTVPETFNWTQIILTSAVFTTEAGMVEIPVVRVDVEDGDIVAIGGTGTVVYDGNGHILTVIPVGDGEYTFTLTPANSADSTEDDWINAGTYKLTITINPNYRWSSSDEYNGTQTTLEYYLVIQKRNITVSADDKNVIFGEAAPEYTISVPVIEGESLGMAGSETLEALLGTEVYNALLSCVYEQGDDAGNYDILFTKTAEELNTLLANYNVTLDTGVLTVAQLELTLDNLTGDIVYDDKDADLWATLIADGLKVTYNSETHEITLSGYDAEKLDIKVLYNGSETAPENAGTYTVALVITVKDAYANNYAIEGADEDGNVDLGSVTLEIEKLALNVTIPNYTHTFNGAAATLPTDIKVTINHTDGTEANEQFILDEVLANMGLTINGSYVNAGSTGSTVYNDVIVLDTAFSDSNYTIAYLNAEGQSASAGDLTIEMKWESSGNNDRVYNGEETVFGETDMNADIYGWIVNNETIKTNVGAANVVYTLSDYPKAVGTYNDIILTCTVTIDGVENKTSVTITGYVISAKAVNIVVNKTEANYLQDYRDSLIENILANEFVAGDGFTPEYIIEILAGVDGEGQEIWTDISTLDTDLAAGIREVGTYTVRVTLKNAADATNYEITYVADTDAEDNTLVINQATLASVVFAYNKDNASWTAIGLTTDGEDINKYGAVTVVYTVTAPDNSTNTLASGVLNFNATQTGEYSVTASVDGDNTNFISSTAVTETVYSVTFADGEHTMNDTNIDAAITAWAPVQYRFAGQTADRPDDAGAPALEGYTFGGWLNGADEYGFTEGVTADITLNIKWNIVSYTITWIDANGNEYTTTVTYRGNPVYDGPALSKDGDSKYTYEHDGWHSLECIPNDTAIDLTTVEVKGDMTFYAHFKVTAVGYKVIFHVWNDKTNQYDALDPIDTAYGVLLDDLHKLTQMDWFIHDVWYTDEGRTGEQLTTVPSSEGSNEINLYGAYKFDIGTGDVNADGAVDTDDITLYRKWIVGGYNMTVVECASVAELWDYVQTADFDVNATHFIIYVADTNVDEASDIRDITTVRMALVGGYGYVVNTGSNVTGDEVAVNTTESSDITYSVQTEEGITVQTTENGETVTITDSNITAIKVNLSSVPENYDKNNLSVTVKDVDDNDITGNLTVTYETVEEDSIAYIGIAGLDWDSYTTYTVTFDMDGTGTEYNEHTCTITYQAPATE